MPESHNLVAGLTLITNRKWYLFVTYHKRRIAVCRRDDPDGNGRPWSNTNDPEHLRYQFQKAPNGDLCLATGPESGVFVLDIDAPGKHEGDGFETLTRLATEGLTLPTTLMAATAHDGRHYYFKYDASHYGPIKSGEFDKNNKSGIDVKGEGGMVLVPPSLGYSWINENAEIAEAPLWLLKRIARPEPPPRPKKSDDQPEREWSFAEIEFCLNIIPNDMSVPRDQWISVGMALWSWSGGSEDGLRLFHFWSKKWPKYNAKDTDEQWRHFKISPPTRKSVGTIIWLADAVDPYWRQRCGAEQDSEFLAQQSASLAKPRPTLPPPTPGEPPKPAQPLSINDFVCYAIAHQYILLKTGELWPASSVNGALPLIVRGKSKIKPTQWLDRHRMVEQMTWAPGQPRMIKDRLLINAGWLDNQPGAHVYNLFKPALLSGASGAVDRWYDHIALMFGDAERNHIVSWFAFKVQHPAEKINHALVLGSATGVGKDTIIEPLRHAVGEWNFGEATPRTIAGRFNRYLQNVILRVSEAHDTGDISKYDFYDRMKIIIAAPPQTLMIDTKNVTEYAIPNVVAVLITTNYRTQSLYLSADDRRHYCLWSSLTSADVDTNILTRMWHDYYNNQFADMIASFLLKYDLSNFYPKSPPPKTEMFWDIVAASSAPEDSEMADALDALGRPVIVTVEQLAENSTADFSDYLLDRRNRRLIPFRLESCGYNRIRNPRREDGMFMVGGKRQNIYARRGADNRDVINAIALLTNSPHGSA